MVTVLLIMRGKVLEPPPILPPVHVTGPLIVEEAVARETPGRLNSPERLTAPSIVQALPLLASNCPVMSTAPLSVAGPNTPRMLRIESAEGSSKLRLLHALGALTV
jgi:hypothetical protein